MTATLPATSDHFHVSDIVSGEIVASDLTEAEARSLAATDADYRAFVTAGDDFASVKELAPTAMQDAATDYQRDQDAAMLELAEQAEPRHARAPHAAPIATRIGTRLHQLVEMSAAMDAKDARIAELEAALEAEENQADEYRRALHRANTRTAEVTARLRDIQAILDR